jgi:hypothetical protein
MDVRRRLPDPRLLGVWILLLAGAQAADVLTTAVDLQRGGIEANHLVANLLGMGGIGLVLFLKLMLVAAISVAVCLLQRYARRQPMFAVVTAHRLVWRGIQISVIGLLLVAVHNTLLLAQIS